MLSFEQESHESETLVERQRRELADDQEGMRDVHRLIGQELPFLFELKQYQNQPKHEILTQRIKPVDPALFDQWRHKVGVVLQTAPINVNAEGTDDEGDPAKAAIMRRRIEWHLTRNRFANYSDIRERYIGGALAARAWAARWDFVPYLGAYGEIISRLVDPRMLFFPRGYLTPHDPLCPRLTEVFRIPINEARRMPNWKHTGEIQPDAGGDVLDWISRGSSQLDQAGRAYFQNSRGDEGNDTIGSQGFATFAMTWYRFEFDAVKVEKKVALGPGERYMQCLNEVCNLKSPREFEVGPLPATSQCPQCGATMKRIANEDKTEDQLKFEKGKRLVISCLNGSVQEPVFDGPWPVPGCVSFPYLWLTAYKFPHKAIPESDTSIGWDITVARNDTMRVIHEQAHRSRPVFLWPRRGIEDANGTQLDHMDDMADIMFYTSDLPQDAVKVVQALPVNDSLFQLHELLHGMWKENSGDSRVSVGPGETKDIPVGTIKEMVESGNVPLNTFIRSLYDAEGMHFTNLAAYIRHYDTENRVIRFRGNKGKLEYATVRGIDLPDVDVTVSAGPSVSQIELEKVQAIQSLSQVPGPWRRLIGRSMGLAPEFLDEMDEAENQVMATQAPAMPPPGPSEVPPPGVPPELAMTGGPL